MQICEFNVGKARELGFDTRDEPDEQFPDNKAHAHVYCEGYAGKKRKTQARYLAQMCTIVKCS